MIQKYKLLLASSSKYRKQLLSRFGINFETILIDHDEKIFRYLDNAAIVESIAKQKMDATLQFIKNQTQHKNSYILTCDSMIFCKGEVLGKPTDEKDALKQLDLLSDSMCDAITSMCLYNGNSTVIENVKTSVIVDKISKEDKENYAKSKEWEGIAGTLKFQGLGSIYVKSIDGNADNITGLPLCHFYNMLKKEGFFEKTI